VGISNESYPEKYPPFLGEFGSFSGLKLIIGEIKRLMRQREVSYEQRK
jgi:hypothetical protein